MKKILSLIFVTIFVLSSLSISSLAVVGDTIPYEIYADVANQVGDMKDEIDISEYSINVDQLSYLMQHLKYMEPLAYCLNNNYTYYHLNGIVTRIKPNYSMDKETYNNQKAYVNEKIDEIVSTMPENLNDIQKALYFHDYIVLNYEYDLSYKIYDVYNMLVQKKGVCEAYLGLYVLLLRKVGIDACGIASTEKSHAWCEIKINDKWYHVDVTHDDPTYDRPGKVSHTNFLISSNVLSSQHGTDYDPTFPISDTTYDNLTWHSYDNPFVILDGNIYTIVDNNIVKLNIETGETTLVYTIDAQWPAGSSYVWQGCFSGLGKYNDKLVFNTYNKIFTYDVSTNEATELYSYSGDGSIYRLFSYDNEIIYYTSSTPNNTSMTKNTLVLQKELVSIDIEKTPNKTWYVVNQTFDPTGMIVKASYSDGSTLDVSENITYTNAQLTVDDTQIEISYTENEVTKSTTQKISVVNTPKIIIDDKTVVGNANEITLDVKFVNSFPVSNVNLQIDFSNRLKLEQIVFNTSLLEGTTSVINNSNTSINLIWANTENEISNDFVFATLAFSILDYIDGEEFENSINITVVETENQNNNICTYDVSNAKVYVINHLPGDVNDDGLIDNVDLVCIIKYMSGIDIAINKYALDVNNDGKINNKDITRLFQYVSSWEVEIY